MRAILVSVLSTAVVLGGSSCSLLFSETDNPAEDAAISDATIQDGGPSDAKTPDAVSGDAGRSDSGTVNGYLLAIDDDFSSGLDAQWTASGQGCTISQERLHCAIPVDTTMGQAGVYLDLTSPALKVKVEMDIQFMRVPKSYETFVEMMNTESQDTTAISIAVYYDDMKIGALVYQPSFPTVQFEYLKLSPPFTPGNSYRVEFETSMEGDSNAIATISADTNSAVLDAGSYDLPITRVGIGLWNTFGDVEPNKVIIDNVRITYIPVP